MVLGSEVRVMVNAIRLGKLRSTCDQKSIGDAKFELDGARHTIDLHADRARRWSVQCSIP